MKVEAVLYHKYDPMIGLTDTTSKSPEEHHRGRCIFHTVYFHGILNILYSWKHGVNTLHSKLLCKIWSYFDCRMRDGGVLILQTRSPDLFKSYSSTKDILNFKSDEDFLSFLLDTAQPVVSYGKSTLNNICWSISLWKGPGCRAYSLEIAYPLLLCKLPKKNKVRNEIVWVQGNLTC